MLMMVSIVSAYRLMARRGLRTVFFSDQGFLHERGELGSISIAKRKYSLLLLLATFSLTFLEYSYYTHPHTYYNASYAAPLSRLWFRTLGQGLECEQNLNGKNCIVEVAVVALVAEVTLVADVASVAEVASVAVEA